MASITGLTEDQCEALAEMQVGGLLLIERYTKSQHVHEEAESNNGDDRSEGNGETANSHINEEVSEQQSAEEAVNEEVAVDDDGSVSEEDDDDHEPTASGVHEVKLFAVHAIMKEDDGTISDLSLCDLSYSAKPGEAIEPSFQVYGNDIVHTTTPAAGPSTAEAVCFSLKDMVDDESMQYHLYPSCTGDELCAMMFNNRCPANCNQGWLPTQQAMHELVTEDITTVAEHSPVCPVCMGKDLMQEYQTLREILQTSSSIDLGIVVEFYGKLNPRRIAIGYSFKQFDEREWGYIFDDINSDEDGESEYDGQDHGQWGYFAEALDPSSCVVTHPTSEAFIASLPRSAFDSKTSGGIGDADDEGMKCMICLEQFQDGTIVATLPCGHFFCDAGCLEQWLKLSNDCPTCRAKLPLEEDETVANRTADGFVGSGGDQSVTDFASEDNEVGLRLGDDGNDKDGEDVLMLDAPVYAYSA